MTGTTKPTSRGSVRVPLAVAAVAALIALGSIVIPRLSGPSAHEAGSEPGKTQVAGSSTGQGPLASVARRDAGDPTARGRVDAPVVMVAYSDFQCPYCGKFARETEPRLIEKYVDSGILRIEWRDFPYLGKESDRAARAGRAAAVQDKFWAFHDALYAHQSAPNSGKLTQAHLEGVAGRLGLSVSRFRSDMGSPEARSLVDRDFDQGMSAGVGGTPAFVINGRPLIGAQPLAVFEKNIDLAAAAAKKGAPE